MYKLILSIVSIVLIFTNMGCSSESKTSKTSISDETTISQSWSGPIKDAVTSKDIGICGKSKLAKKYNFPGFIMVKLSNEPLTYHSTEQVEKFFSESMFDTGYKLGNLSLWKKSDSNKEIYVGKFNGDQPPKELVVYELGGCA